MTQASVTLYGLAHCDSCRKARRWLTDRDVAVTFHDFSKAGVPPERLRRWVAVAGWERVLNRRGTTWRKLEETTRHRVVDAPSALALLLDNPSAIKRPVVEWNSGAPAVTIGFFPDDWHKRLNA